MLSDISNKRSYSKAPPQECSTMLSDISNKLPLSSPTTTKPTPITPNDAHLDTSEAAALEEQLHYMQQRLSKLRARSGTGTGSALQEERKENDLPTPPKKKPYAKCVIIGTPKSAKTSLELRAESAHALIHLPPQDSKFKILIVGNANCGKTSIIERFVSNHFSEQYQTTVGADFRKKILDWSELGDAKIANKVKLHVFDIAGQDRFQRLTRAYFNKASGALVVCDVTREGTFEAAGEWKRELDRTLTTYDGNGRPIKIPVVLVANKCDLLEDVRSSFVAGARMEQACRQHGFAGWFVTSAKNGDNVEDCMCFLTRQMLAVRDVQRAKMQRLFLKSATDTGFGGGNNTAPRTSTHTNTTNRTRSGVYDEFQANDSASSNQQVVNPYSSQKPVPGIRIKGDHTRKGGNKTGRQHSSGCC